MVQKLISVAGSIPSACLAAAKGKCDLDNMQMYDVLYTASVWPFPPPESLGLTVFGVVYNPMGILPLRHRRDVPSGHTRLVRANWLTFA